MPEGQLELAEPPVLGEPAAADFGSALAYLPMALGSGAMALMFSVGSANPTSYLMDGMMGMVMISMGVAQIGGSSKLSRAKVSAGAAGGDAACPQSLTVGVGCVSS
jgi:S-DNA-T family DNA segregation ATPase FtsK/SpoIIIE